jgi:hypothetical protein
VPLEIRVVSPAWEQPLAEFLRQFVCQANDTFTRS